MPVSVGEPEAGVVGGAALQHDQRVTVGVDTGRDVADQRRADAPPVQRRRDGER